MLASLRQALHIGPWRRGPDLSHGLSSPFIIDAEHTKNNSLFFRRAFFFELGSAVRGRGCLLPMKNGRTRECKVKEMRRIASRSRNKFTSSSFRIFDSGAALLDTFFQPPRRRTARNVRDSCQEEDEFSPPFPPRITSQNECYFNATPLLDHSCRSSTALLQRSSLCWRRKLRCTSVARLVCSPAEMRAPIRPSPAPG
jgi:hypothetical protein